MANTSKKPAQFLFGSQYYRPPTPPVEEWEDDFKRMKALDFNVIKIWMQWRWVEPQKGQYKFDDFDRIFDLCEKYEIGLVPNTILECPPEWVYTTYPDSRLKDINRNIQYEYAYSAYQIGGFRPCWDHAQVAQLGLECLKQIVSRYAGRQCLVAWDVWNEPLQAFCSCDNTHAQFIRSLQNRFSSVEECNAFIGRNYSTFEEVPIPYSKDNLPLMYLMTLFMQDRLAEQISWRSKIVREIDQKVLTMTHSCGPGSSIYRLEADDWKSAKSVDFYGTSMHQWHNRFGNPNHRQVWSQFPLCLDATLSASPYYWVSEVASGESHYGFSTATFSKETIRFWTWSSVAHGAKALIYWQFRPERLGVEAPGWGLVALDGSELDRTAEAKAVASFSSEWSDFLTNAEPVQDRVGILFDVASYFLAGSAAAGWQESPYPDAVRGAYQALWYHNLAPQILTPDSDWSGIDVLYLPIPIMLTVPLAQKIKAYVQAGGTVISEGGLGSYDHRTWFSPTIPGGGLEEVFSVKEEQVLPDREGMPYRGEPLEKHYDLGIRYVIPGKCSGLMEGALFKRLAKPVKAEPVGWFRESGQPALFRHRYGKGTAYYITTHPSIRVARQWDEKSMLGIYDLVTSVIQPSYTVQREGFLTSRLLQRGTERLLFVFNNDISEAHAAFHIPGFAKVECVRGTEPIGAPPDFTISVAPREVAVCHLS